MLRLQRILSLVLCFSLCLIGFAVPVFADDYDVGNATGAATRSSMLFYYLEHSMGNDRLNFFANADGTSDHPLVVTLDEGAYVHDSDIVSVHRAGVGPSGYIEYIFSMPNSGVLEFTDKVTYYASILRDNSQNTILYEYDNVLEIVFLIDNVEVGTYSISEGVPSGPYDVDQRFSFRIQSNSSSYKTGYSGEDAYDAFLQIELQMEGLFTHGTPGIVEPDPEEPSSPTDPSNPSGGGSSGSSNLTEVVDKIEIVQGTLDEINGNVVAIKDSVQEIEVEIKDTKDQLEDSDSNIWQAAGEAISNTIESLFVPSTEDMSEVKQGFDDLAKDKLGGAYTAMETVDDTITQVKDKLSNPSASEGIEFPGISVPLGGDIGTVTLAEKQLVTLPTALTAVLHPLAGTIISIICGLGTFNVLKDMVECFLSGYSFAEYLHRNKGGGGE